MKKLRVTVEGKVYEVLVEMLDHAEKTAPASAPTPTVNLSSVAAAAAPAPAPIAATPAAKPAGPTGAGDVPSPLAGKIVSIDVTVGQPVTEGAQVATIEAMKMNTYIFAPKSGRVDAVLVKSGDGVEEGAILIRIS